MANEQNYIIEILHNPNEVDEQFACQKCGNCNTDSLEIDEQVGCKTDKVLVTCAECGNKYEV